MAAKKKPAEKPVSEPVEVEKPEPAKAPDAAIDLPTGARSRR